MKHWIFGLGKNSNGLPLGAICPYVYRKKTLNPLIRRIIIASSVLLLAISLALSQPNPLWSTSSAAKPHHGNSSYHWMRNRGTSRRQQWHSQRRRKRVTRRARLSYC